MTDNDCKCGDSLDTTEARVCGACIDCAQKELAKANAVIEKLRAGGAGMIAAERQRQVEVEGWTAELDAKHGDGALACAAGCYLRADNELTWQPAIWPWNPKWWKPKDRIRNLVIAGALIAAEIDRLQAARSKDDD